MRVPVDASRGRGLSVYRYVAAGVRLRTTARERRCAVRPDPACPLPHGHWGVTAYEAAPSVGSPGSRILPGCTLPRVIVAELYSLNTSVVSLQGGPRWGEACDEQHHMPSGRGTISGNSAVLSCTYGISSSSGSVGLVGAGSDPGRSHCDCPAPL